MRSYDCEDFQKSINNFRVIKIADFGTSIYLDGLRRGSDTMGKCSQQIHLTVVGGSAPDWRFFSVSHDGCCRLRTSTSLVLAGTPHYISPSVANIPPRGYGPEVSFSSSRNAIEFR